MPTIAQRCAGRLPLRWMVEKTGVVTNRGLMIDMMPALTIDGEKNVQQCNITAGRLAKRSRRYVAGATRLRSSSHPRIRFIHRFCLVSAPGQQLSTLHA